MYSVNEKSNVKMTEFIDNIDKCFWSLSTVTRLTFNGLTICKATVLKKEENSLGVR